MPAFSSGIARTSCCPACGYPTLNASLCHVCSPYAAQFTRAMPSADGFGTAAGAIGVSAL